jgi:serine/threonine protein kinase
MDGVVLDRSQDEKISEHYNYIKPPTIMTFKDPPLGEGPAVKYKNSKYSVIIVPDDEHTAAGKVCYVYPRKENKTTKGFGAFGLTKIVYKYQSGDFESKPGYASTNINLYNGIPVALKVVDKNSGHIKKPEQAELQKKLFGGADVTVFHISDKGKGIVRKKRKIKTVEGVRYVHGKTYTSMPDCGIRIAKFICEANLSLLQKAQLIRDVIAVVRKLHGMKVAHRDIKPDNITVERVVDEDGKVKHFRPRLVDLDSLEHDNTATERESESEAGRYVDIDCTTIAFTSADYEQQSLIQRDCISLAATIFRKTGSTCYSYRGESFVFSDELSLLTESEASELGLLESLERCCDGGVSEIEPSIDAIKETLDYYIAEHTTPRVSSVSMLSPAISCGLGAKKRAASPVVDDPRKRLFLAYRAPMLS